MHNAMRHLRLRLSILSISIVLVWFLGYVAVGNLSLYSPGEISAPHAHLEKNCQACHTGAPGALFRRNVTDAACRTCHSAAIHHANQIYRREVGKQPDCATCHEEHAGRMARPSLVRNSMCTGCHASLQVEAPASGPANRYARTVTSFAGN